MPTTTAAKKPAASRRRAATKTAVVKNVEDTPIYTDNVTPAVKFPEDPVQRDALVNTYWTLKNANIEIPEEIRTPVELWIKQAQHEQALSEERHQEDLQGRIAELNRTGPTFVRNMTHTQFNLRLDSQQGTGNIQPRRLELKPRGTPGDMHPIKPEDRNDPVLVTNLNLGLLELIGAGDAQLIIEKQTHNMSQRVHTPTQILKNEYKILRENHVNVSENPTIRVEAEYGSQGITVATIEPGVAQGTLGDKAAAKAGNMSGGLNRVNPNQSPVVTSQFIPTNGAPASIGFDSMQALKVKDDIARRSGLEGPAAGLGNVKVTVEAPKRLS